MALKLRKLSPHIGAEIQDIDLNEDQSAETVAAINRAWFDNIILLFRRQNLSPERQVQVIDPRPRIVDDGMSGLPKSERPVEVLTIAGPPK